VADKPGKAEANEAEANKAIEAEKANVANEASVVDNANDTGN
jgi:hypothetical protein